MGKKNKGSNANVNNHTRVPTSNADSDDGGYHTPDESKMRSLTRHPDYYITGGDLYLIIGTTIFKIHSYWFTREAKNFYRKLLDPTSPGDPRKGMSESTAIIIDVCTVRDFELLLWVFYNPRYDLYQAETEDFFAILRLSSIWDLPEVTAFALREIRKREDEIPLVERIILYHKYRAPPEYLVPLYAQLCSRPLPPTDDEMKHLGENIGWGEAIKVFRARETVRAQSWSPTDSPGGSPLSPLPEGKSEKDTYPAISSIMGLPEYKPEQDADLDVTRLSLQKNKNASGRTSSRRELQ